MSGPRIIIGAHGSPGSIRALRYAEHLARSSDARPVPVIAWTPPGGDLADRRFPSPELRRVWAEAATKRLRAALDAAWGGLPDGLGVRAVIARGEPGPVLADVADSGDAALSQRWLDVSFRPGTSVAQVLRIRAACSHVPEVTADPIARNLPALDIVNSVRFDITRASDANEADLAACLAKFPAAVGVNPQDASGSGG